MEQLRLIGKRLVYLVVMLFGVATLVFILTKVIPGDPAMADLNRRALNNPEIVAVYRAKYNLDQSLPTQYILYTKNFLQFGLGTSTRTNRPTLSELAECYPVTTGLALFAIVIAAILGVSFDIISATRRNSILNQTVRAVSAVDVSILNFWFVLLVLYLFYYKLKLLPGPGRLSNAFMVPATTTGIYVIDSLLEGGISKVLDTVSHPILPGTVFAAFTMGLITRTARSNLLDVMSTGCIRTTKTKGLSRPGLIIHHTLGNILTPVFAVIGLDLGNLLGDMVPVETIFNWPGVGQFAYKSVFPVDFPSIVGVTLLVVLSRTIINTVMDILYRVINPRVRRS